MLARVGNALLLLAVALLALIGFACVKLALVVINRLVAVAVAVAFGLACVKLFLVGNLSTALLLLLLLLFF